MHRLCWIHLTTRDLLPITPGKAACLCILTEAGDIADDTIVSNNGEDEWMIVHGSGDTMALLEAWASRHYFVGNVWNIILPADVWATFVILFWRHDHATRGKNRFGDKRGNIFWTQRHNGVFQIRNFLFQKALFALTWRKIKRILVWQAMCEVIRLV